MVVPAPGGSGDEEDEVGGTVRRAEVDAGLEPGVVTEKVRGLEVGFGLNAATGEYVDMLAAGISDPVKVTRSALANAASIAGHQGFALLGHYSATKFAVRALTQAAAKELAPHRITVNAYCPGIVGTDMWDLIDEQMGARSGAGKGETLTQYAAAIPLGRVQTADDVAAFVSYLAGPDSDYMTGQAVMIDGGVVMV